MYKLHVDFKRDVDKDLRLVSSWFGWNIFYYINKHSGIKQQALLTKYFTCRALDDTGI